MKEEKHRVAVVLDPDFGNKVQMLVSDMHVWLVESPVNVQAAREVWANQCEIDSDDLTTGITLFRASNGATRRDACIAILEDVEDHHGEYAHDPPLSDLLIIGTPLDDSLRGVLEEFGMTKFSEQQFGFFCSRDPRKS